MGRVALEFEPSLALVYERAFRKVGRFYADGFAQDAVVAAGDWVPPAGSADFDSEEALAAAEAQRLEVARAIEEEFTRRSRDLAISFDPADFPIFSPDLLTNLGQHAGANFDAASRESLGKVIQESFERGLSVADTAKAIREQFGNLGQHSATMLARTDLIGLANGGGFIAARRVFENEPEVQKIWLNAHDSRVRPTHSDAGGQAVAMGEPFNVGGFDLMYPGDPQGPPQEVINCRCTFVTDGGRSEKQKRRDSEAMIEAAGQEHLAPSKGEMAFKIFGNATDTRALYANDLGVYSEARRPLHQQIVAGKLRAGVNVPSNQQNRIMFLAGGSGVGKSTVRNALKAGEKPYRPVTIDPDAIKEVLPEYRQMVKAKDPYSAWGVHEESSAIAKATLTEAEARHKNIIVDGTGDSEPGKFLDKIRKAQATGADVDVVLVDAPIDVAIERVNHRAGETGRVISEATVRHIHQSVSARFPEWRDVTDWRLYDASGPKGSTPTLTAERVNGEDLIYNQSKFQAFLDKANG